MKPPSLKSKFFGVCAAAALALTGAALVATPAAATPCYGVGGPCVGGLTASYHVTDKAGSFSFLVWSNQSSWSATATESWFSVSPSSGRGTTSSAGSRVIVTIKANPNGYNRSGHVIVKAGDAAPYYVLVVQGGVKGERSSLRLEPGSLDVVAGGSKNEVVVNTNASGGWTATPVDSWLTVGPTSGLSGQSFIVMYGPNPTAQPRTGYITIQAGTSLPYSFAVTQAGAGTPPPPEPPTGLILELDYTNLTFPAAARDNSGMWVNNTTVAPATIIGVSSDPSWLKPKPSTAGPKVWWAMTKNTTGKDRIGYITYTAGDGSSAVLTVKQTAS